MSQFYSPRTVRVHDRRSRGCPAGTLREVIVVIGILFLLLIVFLASQVFMPPGREPSRRATCEALLNGTGKSLHQYAQENNDMWPIADHAPAESDEVGRVKYAPGMIGRHRGTSTHRFREQTRDAENGETTVNDTEMSTTRNLWRLLRQGGVSPRAFICPSSSTDQSNDEKNPADFWDFREWKEVSYGYQIPYGKRGRPSLDCDSRMPLTADKGPYGAALENKRKNPGVPTAPVNAAPDAWTPWNSPNHGGEGQNVLFADGHVKFVLEPICGVLRDNIYTRWSDASGGAKTDLTTRLHGTPPTGIETPWSDTDSFIYP
jgi:prepilin-type processing-associated H-X9-DG protein